MSYIAVGIALYVIYLCAKYAFGRPEMAHQPQQAIDLPHSGEQFNVDVVGERKYKRNIEKISASHPHEGHTSVHDALLILDNTNLEDLNAVRVEIDGLPVGHLARKFSRQYRMLLVATTAPNAIGRCQAQIYEAGRDTWRIYVNADI